MKGIRTAVGLLVAFFALAAPSQASAHDNPSSKSVRAHVKRGDAGLERFRERVADERYRDAVEAAERAVRGIVQAAEESEDAPDVDRSATGCSRGIALLERLAERVPPKYRDDVFAAAGELRRQCEAALAECRSAIERWRAEVYEYAAMLPSERAAQIVREWADRVAAEATQACQSVFGTGVESGEGDGDGPGAPEDPGEGEDPGTPGD